MTLDREKELHDAALDLLDAMDSGGCLAPQCSHHVGEYARKLRAMVGREPFEPHPELPPAVEGALLRAKEVIDKYAQTGEGRELFVMGGPLLLGRFLGQAVGVLIAVAGTAEMLRRRLASAETKAAAYEQDWIAAKCEFGDATGRLRGDLRRATRVVEAAVTYVGALDAWEAAKTHAQPGWEGALATLRAAVAAHRGASPEVPT